MNKEHPIPDNNLCYSLLRYALKKKREISKKYEIRDTESVLRDHRNTPAKGWSFKNVMNDWRYAWMIRNDYSVPNEETLLRRIIAVFHYWHDKELLFAKDDHGSLVGIDVRGGNVDRCKFYEKSHW